jgi:hypothetical protein
MPQPLMTIDDFEIRRSYGYRPESERPFEGFIQFRYGEGTYDYARVDLKGDLMREVMEVVAGVVGRHVAAAFPILPVVELEATGSAPVRSDDDVPF